MCQRGHYGPFKIIWCAAILTRLFNSVFMFQHQGCLWPRRGLKASPHLI